MLCYITVTSTTDNGRYAKARINGIYESEEQALRSIGPERPPNDVVFKWPMLEPPRFAQPVDVHNGQVVPLKHSRLLDALDNALRRDEISHLFQMNDALTKHVSHLEGQLPKKPAVHVNDRDPEPAARQVRDLWLCRGREDAIARIVRDYVNSEKPTLVGRIIAAPDAATVAHLNTQAQQHRLADGNFDPTQGLAHNRVLLHAGDRVQFCRTDNKLGVTDRDLGDVVALFPEFRTIAVALDDRKTPGSDVVLVPLKDYADVDLAYATTYDKAPKMELHQVFVLADSHAPTRQVVDALPGFHVEIYADAITASRFFPEQSTGHDLCQSVDLTADPLSSYREHQ